MSYQNIRDTREGFVRSGIGDRLVRIEAVIVGIIGFCLCMFGFKTGFVTSLIVGVMIVIVLPWLMGLIEVFAWVVITVFSLVWAFAGYFIGGAILGDSPVAGAIVAILIFICSFFVHKVFAGLGYSSVEKHVIDSVDETRDNTAHLNPSSGVRFCSSCGTRLGAGVHFCNKCGSKQ